MTITAPAKFFTTASSFSMVVISKWFVGSSKSKISGSEISAFAKAAFFNSPPDAVSGLVSA